MPDPSDNDPAPGRVAHRVAAAIDGAVHSAAHAIDDAADSVGARMRRWDDRPGSRVRAIRRRGQKPLPMLYEEHPEARYATPREVGLQTIDLADVAGTAVGGARQRGGDFLPVKELRKNNWKARWQRLRAAADRLEILPPIDVVRYDDRYWVLDGHNRVALALYNGQLAIDANVTDLMGPGQSRSGPSTSLESQVDDSRNLRATLSRRSTDRLRAAPGKSSTERAEDR